MAKERRDRLSARRRAGGNGVCRRLSPQLTPLSSEASKPGDFDMRSRSVAALAGLTLFAAAAGFAFGVGAQTVTDPTDPVDTAITTTDDDAPGIESTVDDAVVEITADGSVETMGNDADGISSRGEDVDIDVHAGGTIVTNGVEADGIFSEGAGADISVRGTIETTDSSASGNAYGVHSAGGDAVIEVDGTITTNGFNSFGINSVGDDADISVTGLIRTMGGSAEGIHTEGADARIDIGMGGTIETNAPGGQGIWVRVGSDDIVIDVRDGGRIETKGLGVLGRSADAAGIDLNGDRATVTIHEGGTIVTHGDRSAGIRSVGDDDRISVAGTIETRFNRGAAPARSHGIHSIPFEGGDATIRVDGTILTRGQTSHGILQENGLLAILAPPGTTTDITVTGLIRTMGGDAHGINARRSSTNIDVSGTIRTTGDEADGIRIRGGTIALSGRIDVSGADSVAVGGQTVGDDRDPITLRLTDGWSIRGPIALGADDTVEIDTGQAGRAGMSRTIRIPDVGIFRTVGDGPLPVLRSGDVVAVVDAATPAMQRTAFAQSVGAVQWAVHDRHAAPPRITADTTTAGAPGGPRGWGVAIGGDLERGADGAAPGWDGRYFGVVGGFEQILRDGSRIGVVGGYTRNETATETVSVDADANGVMLGLYGEFGGRVEDGGEWAVTGTLIAGYSQYDATRHVDDNLDGRQTASGSSDGLFLSPSLGLRLSSAIAEGLEFRPSVLLSGVFARHGSYAESGAGVSNVAYDSWTSAAANGRAQLGLGIRLDASAELEARVGATSRHLSDEDVRVRLQSGGDGFAWDIPGERNVLGGFVGARLSWALDDSVSLLADAEYGAASGDERSVAGRLSLTASF